MGNEQSRTNKHGLKRYIDATTQQKIRKDAGYGCVVCGSLFCDYEHIEPEFHNAKEHDPEKMTLLCKGCHGRVTGKLTSKSKVWEAKKKPFCKEHGVVTEGIQPSFKPAFEVGGNLIEDVEVVLTIHGKPLMWFDKPNLDGPVEVNAIFNDEDGKPTTFINRNQFSSIIGSYDILGKGTEIQIRPEKGRIGLILDIEGDYPIKIKKLDMSHLGLNLQVKADGSFVLNKQTHFSGNAISGTHTAFCFGSIPTTDIKDSYGILSINTIACQVACSGIPILTINGYPVGWVLDLYLLNKNYKLVGFLKEKSVYTITGEYIGELIPNQLNNSQFLIINHVNEYETYEPIWVSALDKSTTCLRKDSYIDVSHRLFDSQIFNKPAMKQIPKDKLKGSVMNNYECVTDAVKNGDRIIIDFIGKLDGLPFDGGAAENFGLVIGQGRMIDGFEDEIIGKRCGECFDIEVQLPNNFHYQDLRGKRVVYSVTLKKVERFIND